MITNYLVDTDSGGDEIIQIIVFVKTKTRSSMLKGKIKTKDMKFVFTDISVSFLRSKYQERDRNITKNKI